MIVVWHSFFCVLCQPVHSLSHPKSARFLFRNLFVETCIESFKFSLVEASGAIIVFTSCRCKVYVYAYGWYIVGDIDVDYI